jgi:hypothetical protein
MVSNAERDAVEQFAAKRGWTPRVIADALAVHVSTKGFLDDEDVSTPTREDTVTTARDAASVIEKLIAVRQHELAGETTVEALKASGSSPPSGGTTSAPGTPTDPRDQTAPDLRIVRPPDKTDTAWSLTYSPTVIPLCRCTATTLAGDPCRAWAAWSHPDQVCSTHAGVTARPHHVAAPPLTGADVLSLSETAQADRTVLARRTRCSRRTVKRSLAKLVALGYIEVVEGGA